MDKVTIRRVFNLGNYETITVEAVGEDEGLEAARLKAVYLVLWMAGLEMNRINEMKKLNTTNDPVYQVQLEIQRVCQEIQILADKPNNVG